MGRADAEPRLSLVLVLHRGRVLAAEGHLLPGRRLVGQQGATVPQQRLAGLHQVSEHGRIVSLRARQVVRADDTDAAGQEKERGERIVFQLLLDLFWTTRLVFVRK